jgi:hypothetical protein
MIPASSSTIAARLKRIPPSPSTMPGLQNRLRTLPAHPAKPPVNDRSVIEYEGISGFPSFCQIAHRRHGDRVQFALIHMANGGTSPTNMFGPLATYMRQRFYPEVDAGLIDWYDVLPAGVYHSRDETEIHPVTLQHANGIYSDPAWARSHDIPADWVAFINQTIARGQTAHRTAESAPHLDSAPKTPVAR